MAPNLAKQVLLWPLNPDGTLSELPIKFVDGPHLRWSFKK